MFQDDPCFKKQHSQENRVAEMNKLDG